MGKIEEFLSLYRSKSTVSAYGSGLKNFFNFTYSGIAELEDKADRYFKEGRNFEDDIQRIW